MNNILFACSTTAEMEGGNMERCFLEQGSPRGKQSGGKVVR